MIKNLMYIELKSGYSDDGPAWIGYVKTSKTRKTVYFNDHAFQKAIGGGSNYIDIENGDGYWISGLKKEKAIVIGRDTEKSRSTAELLRNTLLWSGKKNCHRVCLRWLIWRISSLLNEQTDC